MLAGRLTPTAGRVEKGPTVRVGYYTQYGPELDPAARVRDLVAGPSRVARRPRRPAFDGAILVHRGVAVGDGGYPVGW